MAAFTEGGIKYTVQGFSKAFSDLGKLDKAQSGLGASAATLGKSVTGLATGAFSAVAKGVGIATKAIGAFGASIVEEGAAYTKEMSNVVALTEATDEEFKQLSDTAETLGATTKFTATEAAEGMSFLAMAGFEVVDIVEALPGVLDLASAANMDLGRAADITSNILSGFGESTDQTGHLVDVLAKTAASANTDVEQLGQAMKFVAPVAGSLGFSVDETAAALGVLGDAGIQAGNAGRGLRGVLSKLASPTDAAKAAMDGLGVAAFNTDGTMKSLPEIIGEFNDATADMTEQQKAAALGAIFSRGEISPMLVLMGKGKDDIAAFGNELENSAGFAAQVAAKQLDNLSGDVTLFQSALSGVKITIFKALEPLLRNVVKAGTALITEFGGPLTNILNNKVVPAIQGVISFATKLFSMFEGGVKFGAKNVIINLLDTLGFEPSQISEVLTFFDSVIDTVTTSFDKITSAFQKFGARGATISILGLFGFSPDQISKVLTFFDSVIKTVTTSFSKITGAFLRFGARGAAVSVLGLLGFEPDQIAQVMLFFDNVKQAVIQAVTTILGLFGVAAQGATNFSWVDTISNALTFLNNNFELLKGIIFGIGAAFAAASIIATVAGIVAAINPLTLIIVAVGAAVGALWVAWQNNWGNIQAITLTVWEIIKAVFDQVKAVVIDTVIPQLQQAFDNVTLALNSMGLNWSDVWNAASTVLSIVATVIGGLIVGLVGVIAAWVASTATFIATVTGHWQGFVDGTTMMFEGFKQFFSGFWELVQGIFTLNTQMISDGFTDMTSGISDILAGWSEATTTLFTALFDGVSESLSTFIETIVGFFQGLYDTLVGNSIIPDLINGIIEWFGNLSAPITEIIQSLIDIAQSLFSSIIDFFTSGTTAELDFSQLIEDLTVTLPESVQALTELVLEAFTIMTDIVTIYTEFLVQSLAVQAISKLIQSHQKFATSATGLWEDVISVANSYNDLLITIGTSSIPTMGTAFNTAKGVIELASKSINTAIGSIKTKLEQDVPGITSEFDKIKTAIENVGTAIDGAGGLLSKIGSINTKLGEISTTPVSDLETSFNNVKTKIGEVIGKVQELINKINAIPSIPDGPASDSQPNSITNSSGPLALASSPSSAPQSNTTSISIGPNYVSSDIGMAQFEQRVRRAVNPALG